MPARMKREKTVLAAEGVRRGVQASGTGATRRGEAGEVVVKSGGIVMRL